MVVTGGCLFGMSFLGYHCFSEIMLLFLFTIVFRKDTLKSHILVLCYRSHNIASPHATSLELVRRLVKGNLPVPVQLLNL